MSKIKSFDFKNISLGDSRKLKNEHKSELEFPNIIEGIIANRYKVIIRENNMLYSNGFETVANEKVKQGDVITNNFIRALLFSSSQNKKRFSRFF